MSPYSPNPQRITKDVTWYYEDWRGIEIIHYVQGHAEHIRIPWGRLLKSVARHHAHQAAKKRRRP